MSRYEILRGCKSVGAGYLRAVRAELLRASAYQNANSSQATFGCNFASQSAQNIGMVGFSNAN